MRMNDPSPEALRRAYAFLHEHHHEMVARREVREREEEAVRREGTNDQDPGAKQDKA